MRPLSLIGRAEPLRGEDRWRSGKGIPGPARSLGSERGAAREGRPYRDRLQGVFVEVEPVRTRDELLLRRRPVRDERAQFETDLDLLVAGLQQDGIHGDRKLRSLLLTDITSPRADRRA